MTKRKFTQIQRSLLHWFDSHQRDLPWRKSYSAYEIFISELMLQQTQVKTALPYYLRWMERFPDFAAVAAAPEEALIKSWEGLGYYSRVHHIQKTARIVTEERTGVFPSTFEEVLALPGVGRYTAGALMSLVYNADYPVVDGNVERILARIFNLDRPVKEPQSRKFLWETATRLLPHGQARRFNQALMDLGALVCVPRHPICSICPVQDQCESFQLGVQDQRPVRAAKKPSTAIEVAVGILRHKGRIFIQKRPPGGLMPNLWEFPGGKLQEGETPEAALIREFSEELCLRICDIQTLGFIRHSYTSFKVALHAFTCRPQDEHPEPKLCSAVEGRWVLPEELADYAFPAANRELIRLLQ